VRNTPSHPEHNTMRLDFEYYVDLKLSGTVAPLITGASEFAQAGAGLSTELKDGNTNDMIAALKAAARRWVITRVREILGQEKLDLAAAKRAYKSVAKSYEHVLGNALTLTRMYAANDFAGEVQRATGSESEEVCAAVEDGTTPREPNMDAIIRTLRKHDLSLGHLCRGLGLFERSKKRRTVESIVLQHLAEKEQKRRRAFIEAYDALKAAQALATVRMVEDVKVARSAEMAGNSVTVANAELEKAQKAKARLQIANAELKATIEARKNFARLCSKCRSEKQRRAGGV
jgi:hypothetical protein